LLAPLAGRIYDHAPQQNAVPLDGVEGFQMNDSSRPIEMHLDIATARLLRDVLRAQGEHQAAGALIPILDHGESELLGAFLRDLDLKLGGTGRFA
jgi:hypothetical protein